MRLHLGRIPGRAVGRLVHSIYGRNAVRTRFDSKDLQQLGYVSQYGQDKWVAETLFGGQRGGMFVDIGAHDGVSFSNTYFLEQRLDWTGIAFEPNPSVFAKLKANRKCDAINACIAERTGSEIFQVISGRAEMLSGIKRAYDPQHEARIAKELATFGGTKQEIEIPALRLTDLLLERRITTVDYLNIDVEGAELSVLDSLDLTRIRVNVIGIENNYRDWRIPHRLARHGYRLHSRVGDEFYLHPDFSISDAPSPVFTRRFDHH